MFVYKPTKLYIPFKLINPFLRSHFSSLDSTFTQTILNCYAIDASPKLMPLRPPESRLSDISSSLTC